MPTQVQGLGLVDDQGNKSIVVNLSNARQMTNAEYQQLTPAQRNGAIIVTDFPIPEDEDYVEVVADGVKTYATLLNEIADNTDFSKIIDSSAYLTSESVSGAKLVFVLRAHTNSYATFFHGTCENTGSKIRSYHITPNGSLYEESVGTSFSDRSTDKPSNGTKITLYYGTSSEVMNLLTDADHCMMSDGETSVEEAMYVQSHGSQTVIEQSSWSTTTGDTTVTAEHTGYLIGTFNAHSCNGGGVYTHGVIVFIDNIPVANIYSQGDSTAEANSGSFCIPIKKGQVVIVRVNNGTWVGKAYIRY